MTHNTTTNIFLLTHKNELRRNTATSAIVKSVLKHRCKILPWERKNPDPGFSNGFSAVNSVLIYKTGEPSPPPNNMDDISNFILLDGTWQETRKIFNRSPYLKLFPLLELHPASASRYTLRRNQTNSGLCTAEAVMEILRLKNLEHMADELQAAFHNFLLYNRNHLSPVSAAL